MISCRNHCVLSQHTPKLYEKGDWISKNRNKGVFKFKGGTRMMPENIENVLWKKAKTQRCISDCSYKTVETSKALAGPSIQLLV